ncbi:MAG: recombinase A [Myxococcales bacterium FL481]|nr:MAG: recombinase A [Myxococcales bacterium FL481]
MPVPLPSALDELFRTAVLWRSGASANTAPPSWSYVQLTGRLIELSGHGATAGVSAAMALVLAAQERGEPAAWICPRERSYFPPDAAKNGIDLAALVTIFASEGRGAAAVADRLLRSGAFGLAVLDLGQNDRLSIAQQGRLVTLAKQHQAAVVCITEKGSDAPSIGSMVSLRAEVTRRQVGFGRFECTVEVLKDKQRGPGWAHSEVMLGPDGLY